MCKHDYTQTDQKNWMQNMQNWFDYVARATDHRLFTGAIPLPLSARTFAYHVDTELSVDAWST